MDSRRAAGRQLAGGEPRIGRRDAIVRRQTRGDLADARQRRETPGARIGVRSHQHPELELSERDHRDADLIRQRSLERAVLLGRDEDRNGVRVRDGESGDVCEVPCHVYLETPLGTREVVDGATGEPIPYKNIYASLGRKSNA